MPICRCADACNFGCSDEAYARNVHFDNTTREHWAPACLTQGDLPDGTGSEKEPRRGVDRYDEVKTSMMIKVWMYDKRFRKMIDEELSIPLVISLILPMVRRRSRPAWLPPSPSPSRPFGHRPRPVGHLVATRFDRGRGGQLAQFINFAPSEFDTNRLAQSACQSSILSAAPAGLRGAAPAALFLLAPLEPHDLGALAVRAVLLLPPQAVPGRYRPVRV